MANNIVTFDKGNSVLFKRILIDLLDDSTSIIVPETFNAIIVKDGIALETLPSGRHYVYDKVCKKTSKLTPLKESLIYVIFISKTVKLKIFWGTANQWEMRDPNTGTSIKMGASGEFEVQISNPRKAYLELIGESDSFDMDELKERLQGRLLAEVHYNLSNVMHDMKISFDRLGEVLLPVSKQILPHIQKMFEDDYGLKIFSFTISEIIISNSDIKKIENSKQTYFNAKEKERLDDKKYERDLDLKKLEIEDYDKYLEVVRKVGWPGKPKTDTTSKECPNCQAPLKGENKFCPVCGYELVKTKIKCPNCSKLINKSDTFCKHCGAKVGG